MRREGLRAQVGYKRRPGKYGTKAAIVAANKLQQNFSVDTLDTVWLTDITYTRTHEGWLYLVGCHRSVFSQSHRIVDELTHANLARFERSIDGRLEP